LLSYGATRATITLKRLALRQRRHQPAISVVAHDCFGHLAVAALTIELATKRNFARRRSNTHAISGRPGSSATIAVCLDPSSGEPAAILNVDQARQPTDDRDDRAGP
jgi:hypothetical protein